MANSVRGRGRSVSPGKNKAGKPGISIFYKIALVTGSLAALFFGVFALQKIKYLQQETANSVVKLQQELDSRKRTGYVAITDIKCGDEVTEDMLQQSSNIISDVAQEQFFTADDIGKQAIMNIEHGTPVFAEMVSATLAEEYRERECSFIWLNTNLSDNDCVDIRILFPNGEDYIIASKKYIKNVSVAANNCFLWLTEDENALLSAAIVDANMHNAKVYTTKYLKPEIQEASKVTYVPNEDVISVIAADPNIVDRSASNLSKAARKAMSDRLQTFENWSVDWEKWSKNWANFVSDWEYADKVGGQEVTQSDADAQKESEVNEVTDATTDTSTGEVSYVE